MALKTFILAAGLGTRLRPYTHNLPKPAVPFLGIPMLGYAMYLSHKAQIYDLVINTHPMPEKINSCFSHLSENRFRAEFSFEAGEPQGSGGALYCAQHYLKECQQFFAINGDTVFVPWRENLLLDLLSEQQKHRSLCTLLVSEDPKLVSQFNPLWVDSNNALVGIGEKPQGSNIRPVHYMGVKVFDAKIFKYVPPGNTNIFKDVLFPAIARGEKVQTLTETGYWWETGNFESFFNATVEAMKLIDSNKDNQFFRNVYEYFHKNFDFSVVHKENHIQFIHKQSQIEPYNVNESAFIDGNTKSKPNVSLTNVIINKGAHVQQSLSHAMCFEEDKWSF